MGRILLADLDDDELDEIYGDGQALEGFTDQTPRDIETLRVMLRDDAARGIENQTADGSASFQQTPREALTQKTRHSGDKDPHRVPPTFEPPTFGSLPFDSSPSDSSPFDSSTDQPLRYLRRPPSQRSTGRPTSCSNSATDSTE